MTYSIKTAVKATASVFAATLALAGCRESSAVDPSSAETLSEPPMWSVRDADSEVILYGTVHILPEGIEWDSERLDAAISRSGEIWYEIGADAMNDPSFQQTVMELGMNPDGKLSETLSADTLAKLQTRLDELGVPLMAVEPMRPWMAAISLPSIQLMQAGYSGEEGVETKLQARGDTASLGQRNFETPEQQMRFFSDMSEGEQVAMLDQTLEQMDEGTAMLDRLADAWATGDVDTLEAEFIDGMADYPELYDTLIVRRNQDWAEQLDAEMKGEGVDFVAVGAGHLVGPDSVPALMAAKGYEVELLTAK